MRTEAVPVPLPECLEDKKKPSFTTGGLAGIVHGNGDGTFAGCPGMDADKGRLRELFCTGIYGILQKISEEDADIRLLDPEL